MPIITEARIPWRMGILGGEVRSRLSNMRYLLLLGGMDFDVLGREYVAVFFGGLMAVAEELI